jgi:hypothetical protein
MSIACSVVEKGFCVTLGPVTVTVDVANPRKMNVEGDGLDGEAVLVMLDRFFPDVQKVADMGGLVVYTKGSDVTAGDVQRIVVHCRKEALGG